jgi:hypothetical protein
MYNNFFSEILAVYESMWQNMVMPGRTHNTVHALCMLNNWGWGHTLEISNIYCFSTATTVMPMRFSVTLCVHRLSSINFLCLSRWLHPDLFCNFTDLHFGPVIQRVCGSMLFLLTENFYLTSFKMNLTGFSSKLCTEVAAHRNHSVLVINLLFIQSVVCSCSQPLTAHFSAAQIQTCIPTLQPQPNIFIKECAVF